MPRVEKWNPEADGPLTEEALRSKLKKKGYRVSRYVYPPGTYFPEHTHAVNKIDAVFSGRFRMTTPQGSVVLEAGDCLVVPAAVVHSARVEGGEPVVSFDAVSAP